jgi:hypothetical protein
LIGEQASVEAMNDLAAFRHVLLVDEGGVPAAPAVDEIGLAVASEDDVRALAAVDAVAAGAASEAIVAGAASDQIGAGAAEDVAIYGEPLDQSDVQAHLAVSEAAPATVLLAPILGPDYDEDGVSDSADNCVATANPEQEDANFDGIGDACESEPDSDEDGVADEVDNCPDEPNPLQEDENENGVGDVCETK